MMLVGFRLVGYSPQRGWLMLFRSNSVRHKFPLRVTYFRQVLPPVRGFPTLRVLLLIRLPIGIRHAFPFTVLLCLPLLFSSAPLRLRHSSVSGFPLSCLIIRIPYDGLPTARSLWGLPSSSTHLF